MMRRQRDELITPPHSLRRRQQTQHSEAGPPGLDMRSGHFLSSCSNQMLDLSICHPSRPFSNLFSVLATTPPTSAKPSSFLREFPAATSRRTRNSRGTKEAKKRRDMRRNRRKLAAQLLDQQISQAIEETLTKTNFHLPPQLPQLPRKASLAPASSQQTDDSPLSQSAYRPSTPMEFPMPEFSDFDLRAFPSFPDFTPLSLRTPSPFRTLPSWCLRIPSLTLGDIWRDSLPTFHDLSGLPEPVEASSAMKRSSSELCRDVQVWRPIGSILGREQSKFFPSIKASTTNEQNDNTARVKLPQFGCCLHRSEREDHDTRSSDCVASYPPPTYSLMEEVATALPGHHASLSSELIREDSGYLPHTPQHLRDKNEDPASASIPRLDCVVADGSPAFDLRHIFPWKNPQGPTVSKTWLSSDNLETLSRHASPEYCTAQPPYELEGHEVELPYVHANSLTGYSNESEDTVVHFRNRELPDFADSTIGLPVIRLDYDNVGMNELVVDRDMFGPADLDVAAGVPLPVSLPITPPATPPSQSIQDIVSLTPVNYGRLEAEHRHSDAHFYSEQALFTQSPMQAAQSTDLPQNQHRSGSIDIADFLKLGHAKQCWCDHCDIKSCDPSMGQNDVQWASSPTLTDQTCVNNDSTLSLVLNPSESNFESDSESEAPELLDLFDYDRSPAASESDRIQATEDEDWLVFSHPEPTLPGKGHESTSSSPLYLPSSPVLHRQRQQRASAPTIIVTTSSDTSVDDRSDDYVAVPPPTASMGRQTPAWHDMFPRRSSSGWETGLAALSDEPTCHGLAKTVEGSWTRASEGEEEWWDWAVEEEC